MLSPALCTLSCPTRRSTRSRRSTSRFGDLLSRMASLRPQALERGLLRPDNVVCRRTLQIVMAQAIKSDYGPGHSRQDRRETRSAFLPPLLFSLSRTIIVLASCIVLDSLTLSSHAEVHCLGTLL